MARFPCDATGHRYGGKQASVYISAYAAAGKQAWVARLCQTHFSKSVQLIEAVTTDWLEPILDEPIMCPVCRLLEADGYLVATSFNGDEPRKRAGCVCSTHVEDLLSAFEIDPQLAEKRD